MEKGLQKHSFSIGNIHCSSCEGKVIKLLTALDGVEEVLVNVLRKKMYVTLDMNKENPLGVADIEAAMQKAGYTATPLSLGEADESVEAQNSIAQNNISQAPSFSSAQTPFMMAPTAAMPTQKPTPAQGSGASLQEQAFLLNRAHCASCQGKIHAALMALDGIEEAHVNTLSRSIMVKYNPAVVCPATIVEAFAGGKYALQEVSKKELPPLIPLIQNVKQKKVSSLQKHQAKQEPPSPVEDNKKKIAKQAFKIGNVHCSSCEDRVNKLLRALGGVQDVQVNLLRKTMLVHFDATCIDAKGIAAAMEGAGYAAAAVVMSAPDSLDSPDSSDSHNKPSSQTDSTTAHAPSSPAQEESTKEAFPIALGFSLFFATLLMYVAMAPMFALPLPIEITPQGESGESGESTSATWLWALMQALLCAPILFLHKRIFISGLRALLQKSPNMDSLVGLGSAAAAVFGLYALGKIYMAHEAGHISTVDYFSQNLYFDSAGMILALIGLGKYFESKARTRAGSAIDALMRLTPPTALCLRDGKEVSIATAAIRPGDVLVVYAGESLAADGIIVHGHAFIDTSVITGESLPQEKKIGDTVIGATVSQSGYFHMRVTKAGAESTLAHIIDLVESATASKAPIARLADKISAIFVPIIITIAIITLGTWLALGASFEFALSAAISVLVISCPCALGLATPTAIMVGMGLGAEKGILFKSAAALEHLQAVDTVILDKTGTLTHGSPTVTDIYPHEDTDENTLLRLAASVERLSEHPLGKAIVSHAQHKNIELLPKEDFENFTQLPGLGLTATLSTAQENNAERLLAGNARLLTKENIPNPLLEKEKEWARQGKTVLYFCQNETLLGLIAVADTIKPTSKSAVQSLKALGLNVLMLTGDNAQTAKAVQQQADIETIVAEVLPQEKAEQVQKLEESGHKVAMVGDGINDAPALASAHVGIAIGAGTDIAIKSADIVLMQSDVMQVSAALRLSKAVMRTIQQNLFWAFAYNILLIPVAAGLFSGFGLMLSPMLAAASMSISSLTVVGNALRLRLQKKGIF